MKSSLFMGVLIFALLGSALPVQAQEDAPLKVVASFSILADVVQNVAGYDVDTLIPYNADPHTFSPTPQDVVRLADADVIFISGAALEGNLLETIQNAGEDVNIVTVSSCVEILLTEDAEHHDEEDTNHEEHAHDDEMGSQCEAHHQELGSESEAHHEDGGFLFEQACEGEEEDHAAEEHEGEHHHGACDPHVWTNPENVMLWTLMVRDTLIELDPEHAEQYIANAAAYIAELQILNTDIEVLVDTLPAENRILVTNHETLGYFAAAYDFQIVGTVMSSASSEPSAADLAKLIDTVNETGVLAIFAENTLNTSLVEQIASETGATFLTLYTDSLTEGEPAGTYLDYMRYNTQTIVDGLQS